MIHSSHRKSRDQIKVLVGIPVIVNTVHRPFQFYQIHVPVDLPDRVRICRLDTDLQLDQTRAHLSDQFQLLLVKDIRGNLEVEFVIPLSCSTKGTARSPACVLFCS